MPQPNSTTFTLSVLMPVYNERYLVEASMRRALAFASPLVRALELIAIDDGSTDGSGEIIDRMAAEDARVLAVHQPNGGKGAAIRAAIGLAGGDLCVIQDADLEYDPEDWHKLLRPFVEANADAVYGSRFLSGDYRRVLYYWHTVGNRLLTTFSNMMSGLNLTDMETCYKMVRTQLLKSIPLRSNDFSLEVELTAKLAKRGAVMFEVPIRYLGRTYQEGKKINWRHGLTALTSIVRWRFQDDLFTDDRYGSDILRNLSRVHHFNRWMADTLRPYVGQRVLEIGAGLGNLTNHFLPRQRYLATDVNPHYLDYLRNFAAAKPYLSVEALDLADQPAFTALQGSFDTAICLNVLEHVPDEAGALHNLHRSLAPGGRAIVLVPRGKWLYSPLDRVLGHVKRYHTAELAAAMENAGFELERVFGFNRVGVPGWLFNGVLLRRRRFSRLQLKILNSLIPLIRRIDRAFPWPGLSVIAVGRKR